MRVFCSKKPSLVGEGWVRRFKIVLFLLLKYYLNRLKDI